MTPTGTLETTGGRRGPGMGAWRFVIAFGTVSLLADFVYEGARSITGPLLAHLGAAAAVVGIVTGIGEAAALVLRLGSGPLAVAGVLAPRTCVACTDALYTDACTLNDCEGE
ncbi:hypothetical protein AB0D14_35780 [Streptomyces sp. NPDC048484]|uniref:hypothetical protein n=1 Tax=Streptomyces sp. NPDC048484 TaxID=3155146 RepID=UPI00342BB5C7